MIVTNKDHICVWQYMSICVCVTIHVYICVTIQVYLCVTIIYSIIKYLYELHCLPVYCHTLLPSDSLFIGSLSLSCTSGFTWFYWYSAKHGGIFLGWMILAIGSTIKYIRCLCFIPCEYVEYICINKILLSFVWNGQDVLLWFLKKLVHKFYLR